MGADNWNVFLFYLFFYQFLTFINNCNATTDSENELSPKWSTNVNNDNDDPLLQQREHPQQQQQHGDAAQNRGEDVMLLEAAIRHHSKERGKQIVGEYKATRGRRRGEWPRAKIMALPIWKGLLAARRRSHQQEVEVSFDEWPQAPNDENFGEDINSFHGFPANFEEICAENEEDKFESSSNLIAYLLTYEEIAKRTAEIYKKQIETMQHNELIASSSSELWCSIIDKMLHELRSAATVSEEPRSSQNNKFYEPKNVAELIVGSNKSASHLSIAVHYFAQQHEQCAPHISERLFKARKEVSEKWKEYKGKLLGTTSITQNNILKGDEKEDEKTKKSHKNGGGEGLTNFCRSWWNCISARNVCAFAAKAVFTQQAKYYGRLHGRELGDGFGHNLAKFGGALLAEPIRRNIGGVIQAKHVRKACADTFKVLGQNGMKLFAGDFGKHVVGAPLGNAIDGGIESAKSYLTGKKRKREPEEPLKIVGPPTSINEENVNVNESSQNRKRKSQAEGEKSSNTDSPRNKRTKVENNNDADKEESSMGSSTPSKRSHDSGGGGIDVGASSSSKIRRRSYRFQLYQQGKRLFFFLHIFPTILHSLISADGQESWILDLKLILWLNAVIKLLQEQFDGIDMPNRNLFKQKKSSNSNSNSSSLSAEKRRMEEGSAGESLDLCTSDEEDYEDEEDWDDFD